MFDLAESQADRIVERVAGLLSEETARESIEVLKREIEDDRRLRTPAFRRSRLSQVLSVVGRLDLYDRLSTPTASEELWAYYEPLSSYLLLTCFDILGQRGDWMPFGDWLNAERSEIERQEALKAVSSSMEPVEVSQIMYRAYLDRSSMRRAFHRFIDDVLPASQAKTLLQSVQIRRDSDSRNQEDEVKEYLYQARNDFTHVGQVSWGLHYPEHPGIEHLKETWVNREQWVEADSNVVTVLSRNWPYVIEDSLKAGLASFLQSTIE